MGCYNLGVESVVLKQKDRHTVQVKLRYMLERGEHRRNLFRTRLYLFFPQSFGIGPRTFAPRALHDQIQQYVRFHTPELAAAELLNPDSALSPLARIEREIAQAGSGPCAEGFGAGAEAAGEAGGAPADARAGTIDVAYIRYEARLLGTIFKALMRDTLYISEDPDEPEAVGQRRVVAPDEWEGLVEIMQRMHAVTVRVASCTEVHRELALIDEYMSLMLEQYFSSYLVGTLREEEQTLGEPGAVARTGLAKVAAGAKALARSLKTAMSVVPAGIEEKGRADWLARMIRKEEKHRRKAGYPTCPTGMKAAPQLEEYVYRKMMLRRYASQVLFFPVQPTNTYRQAEHFLYALAAGVAMVVATVIAFFGQSRFGDATFSLFVLLVVGYMVKDRLKELSRELFARQFGRYFPDRTLHLRSDRAVDSLERSPPARRLRRLLGLTRPPKMATVALRTTYVAAAALPPHIRSLRNRGEFEKMVLGVDSEQSLLFEQRTVLRSRILRTLHTRIRGLANVFTIDVEPFLRRLAVQHEPVPEVLGKHTVNVRSVQRVYHMNLIIELEGHGERTLRRYRVIATKRGILRIEPVRADQVHAVQAG